MARGWNSNLPATRPGAMSSNYWPTPILTSRASCICNRLCATSSCVTQATGPLTGRHLVAEMWIIFKREFFARVANKTFLIGTLLFPMIMMGIVAIQALTGDGGSQRTLVLIDEAPPGVASRFVEVLNANRAGADDFRYRIEPMSGTLAEHGDELNRRVLAKQIDGYIALPADI